MTEQAWQEYKAAQPKKKAPKPYVKHWFEVAYIKERNIHWLNDMFASDELKEEIIKVYGI